MMKLLISILITLPVLFAFRIRYDGYLLIQLHPKTLQHIDLLKNWQSDQEFDIWNDVRELNDNVDVLLSPSAFIRYKKLFKLYKFDYDIIEDNIQRRIDEEAFSIAKTRSFDVDIKKNVIGKYANYEQIIQYLDKVSEENPNYVSTYSAGKTYEGRDLKVLLFKTKLAKRSIWINCGLHAREWVAFSTCTWFINRLVTEYNNKNAEVIDLLNHFEIHIIPVLNPDGYEFSRIDRFWRKNRRPNPIASCYGVDLNRNFPFKWMESDGASSFPCSDIYAGHIPASELETQAVLNVISSKEGQWDAFIDIHSYGNLFLLPYGYTRQQPADFYEMFRVASISSKAIRRYNGTSFTIGSTASVLYFASGVSTDWAYGAKGIKYSYCLELRPHDSETFGVFGFLFDEKNAPLVGEEVTVGLIALFKEVKSATMK